jgi:LPXTG-site transpeptidase (sortase) family protein
VTVNVLQSAPSSVINTATVSGGGDVNTSNNAANDPTNIISLPLLPNTSGPDGGGDSQPISWLGLLGVIAGTGGLALAIRGLYSNPVRFRHRRRRRAFSALPLTLALALCTFWGSPSMTQPASSPMIASSAAVEAPAGAVLIGTTVVNESKPAAPHVEETFHPASAPITPARLRIPSIGVDAPVASVGILRDGSMAVPDNLWVSGWLSSGARPGQPGKSVIAGHRGVGGPALFSHLEDLRPGDRVHVSDAGGGEHVYEVTRVALLDLSFASQVEVFGPTSQQQLVLITCFGQYSRNTRTYDHRLAVFSRIVSPGA